MGCCGDFWKNNDEGDNNQLNVGNENSEKGKIEQKLDDKTSFKINKKEDNGRGKICKEIIKNDLKVNNSNLKKTYFKNPTKENLEKENAYLENILFEKYEIDVKFHYLNDTSLDNSTTSALVNKRKECRCEGCDYCIVVKKNGIDESYIFIKGETAEEITKTNYWGEKRIYLHGFKIEEKTKGVFLIREEEKEEFKRNSYITERANNLLFFFREQGTNKSEPKVKIQGVTFSRFKQMIEGIVEDYKKRQNEGFKEMNNQGIGLQSKNEIEIQ